MSSRKPKRGSANPVEHATLTVNEKILKECYDLYAADENGLVQFARELGIPLLEPRRKITVLLIGNHSAGKSSYINWYIEEHVLKTGVAIETQGFALVTSGRKRESLTGNATLKLFPHYQELAQHDAVVNYLSTEISTSRQKKFCLVTFIDTPGLVDGDMRYPFNVDDAIVTLGGLADLIFVFFDPIGQALCKRTLNVVERLSKQYTDRIKFYLSKSDTAGGERDRQKVLMQITQEICRRPSLSRAGFEMPTIFVPTLTERPPRCENQIEETCQEVDKAIDHGVQNTLNSLEQDCDKIVSEIDSRLEMDRKLANMNCYGLLKAYCIGMASFWLFWLLVVIAFDRNTLTNIIGYLLGDEGALVIGELIFQIQEAWQLFPSSIRGYVMLLHILAILLLLLIARECTRNKSSMKKAERRTLVRKKEHVLKTVRPRKDALYQTYLKQSINMTDL